MVEVSDSNMKTGSSHPSIEDDEQRDGQSSTARVELPTYNDLSSVANVKERILSACENIDLLVVDGSKVERMDTSTIQALVAAHMSFAKEKVNVVFAEPSEVMVSAFSDLGLAAEIEMWSA